MNRALLAAVATFVAVFPAQGVQAGLIAQARPPDWAQDQAPLRVFGNTYYVGTRGLTAKGDSVEADLQEKGDR